MSDPTPPTPDPTASAREWAEVRPAVRTHLDGVLEREEGLRYRDCGENSRSTALARRVLADAPAMLARLEEAERLLREALPHPRVGARIDAFLAPSTPRAEGPSRG